MLLSLACLAIACGSPDGGDDDAASACSEAERRVIQFAEAGVSFNLTDEWTTIESDDGQPLYFVAKERPDGYRYRYSAWVHDEAATPTRSEVNSADDLDSALEAAERLYAGRGWEILRAARRDVGSLRGFEIRAVWQAQTAELRQELHLLLPDNRLLAAGGDAAINLIPVGQQMADFDGIICGIKIAP
jgi:hypothetical protein